MEHPPDSGTRTLTVVGFLAAVALAVALRASALPAGLPLQLENPDECGHLERSLRMAGGDPDPHFYIYPSLHYYLLAAALRLRHGDAVSTDPLGYWSADFALTARLLGLCLGLGSVLAMFLAGRRLTGGGLGGVLAAVLTAVNRVHLGVTSDTAVDASMSFFLCLTLWAIVRVCQSPSLGNCVLAGLFAGLASSCKQPALALYPLVLLAYGLASGERDGEPGRFARAAVWALAILSALVCIGCLLLRTLALPELVQSVFGAAAVEETLAQERYELGLAAASAFLLRLAVISGVMAASLVASGWARGLVARMLFRPAPLAALGAGAVVFACTSPFLFIRYTETLRATLHLAYQGFAVKLGRGFVLGSWDYALQLGRDHGVLWMLLAAGVAVYAVRQRWTAGVVVAVAAIGYFFAFAGHGTPFPWYMLPASHALDLLAAAGLVLLWQRLAVYRHGVAAWTALAALVLAWPLTASVARVQDVNRLDTRTLALHWIADNLPEKSVIVRTALTPQPEVLGDRFRTHRLEYRLELMGSDYLARQQAEYVILSGVLRKTWQKAPGVYARELRGYEWVEENLELVKQFHADRGMKGPEISIYRVRAAR